MCLDLPSSMHFSDILSLCMSILGLYGLIYYLRYLIPRNVLPCVSAVLTEAERLLDHAESTGAIPQLNDHRSTLITYEKPHTSANNPSPHQSLTQLRQSILADADGKPSCSWNTAATPACSLVRPDIQAVHTPVTSRGHQDKN